MRPLPERLVSELTAHRTWHMRDAREQSRVALTALPDKTLSSNFMHNAPGACWTPGAARVLPVQADGTWQTVLRPRRTPPPPELARTSGRPRLPEETEHVGSGLTSLEATSALRSGALRLVGVNALYDRADRYGGPGVRVMECSNALPKRTGSLARSASTWVYRGAGAHCRQILWADVTAPHPRRRCERPRATMTPSS